MAMASAPPPPPSSQAVLHPRLPSSTLLFSSRRPRPPPRGRRCRPLVASSAPEMPWPHVLTASGSDSGGGAGIQADIKACAALGAYCSSVVTAVTAQNTAGVQGIHVVPEEFIREQLNSVLSDMSVDVLKTGMLPAIGVVRVLCESLKKFPVKALVVDPVMVSTSGDTLSESSTLSVYRDELFAMADIVTPNLKEASRLLGDISLRTVSDMHSAAESIYKFGPKYVVVKGGNMPESSDAVDVFFDGKEFIELHGHHIKTHNTHGTGCTLASCISSELAKGAKMLHAVQVAKNFVESVLHHSKDLIIGMDLKAFSTPFSSSVTDSSMNKKWGRSIKDAVQAAIEGGATIVQLREEDSETREFLEAAKACMEICMSSGVPLLMNDRVDVALACNADGVHVGQLDMSYESPARPLLKPSRPGMMEQTTLAAVAFSLPPQRRTIQRWGLMA